MIGRGCRSGRWRRGMGCIAGRCRQALASPVPPAKRAPVSRPAPKLGPYRAVIDAWLEADREAPRKQRHTAKRIWRRLVDEHGAEVAETTVRRVRARAQARDGLAGRGGVRPAGPRAGRRGRGRLGRGAGRCSPARRTKVHLFVMRASFSGAAFCQASLVETQQAFLELHVAGVRVVRRRVRADPLRQPDVGGQAGAEGPPAGRDRPVRRAALALPVRVAVHDAGPGGRAREGRRRGRGRPLPPQPPRPGPGGRATSPSSTRCCSPAARRISAGGSTGGR